MIGVPLSPEPLVKSHKEPSKSVNCLGVVPWEAMLPTKSDCFALMLLEIASFNSAPLKSLKSLSARYFNFNSFGVPRRPSVNAGETTGSAHSHILPCGSLKAPSP